MTEIDWTRGEPEGYVFVTPTSGLAMTDGPVSEAAPAWCAPEDWKTAGPHEVAAPFEPNGAMGYYCTTCGEPARWSSGGVLVHVDRSRDLHVGRAAPTGHNPTMSDTALEDPPASPYAADQPVVPDWYTDPRLSYAQGLTDGFNNGVAAGIRLANKAVDRAITAALRRPDGHGGPDLDQEVRDTMREVFERYLGIGRLID